MLGPENGASSEKRGQATPVLPEETEAASGKAPAKCFRCVFDLNSLVTP